MNFFELDISYFQRVNQLNFQEMLFLGLFHGIVFSLPFSAPLLICFRRFLLDGFKIGTFALSGTLFGQFTFLLFIFLGFRPLIQCWYICEPFLAFFGMSLALNLAIDFFHQKNFGLEETSFNKFIDDGNLSYFSSLFSKFQSFFGGGLGLVKLSSPFGNSVERFFTQTLSNIPGMKSNLPGIKIFGFHFLLMLLNPAFPATSTRLILGQDLLDGSFSSSSGIQFCIFYCLGFIFGSILLVSSFVVLFKVFSTQIVGGLRLRISRNGFRSFAGAGGAPSSATVEQKNSQNRVGNSLLLNKAFVFLIVGCLLQGTVQYSWRLFTQYPIEFIGWKSFSKIDDSKPVFSSLGGGAAREFPSFDSNIRHREKNLGVERHVPVEKINTRRTLSGRPPLNEEQKSDAYLKYNSFFLNKISQAFEDSKIKVRTPDFHVRTYEEIQQLQKMKQRFLKAQSLLSGYKNSILSDKIFSSVSIPTEVITKARPLENTTKGKPKFSYIRELVDKTGASSGRAPDFNANQEEMYLHDDLQIYHALFKILQ